MVILNTFSKKERLSNKKHIQNLFEEGDSYTSFPINLIYLQHPLEKAIANQVLITVPKRKFKKAVDRNRIKRRIKEAYRLNKHLLISKKPSAFYLLGYIYLSNKELPYKIIEDNVKVTLSKLASED